MSGMDQFLAEYYGTDATSQDTEKVSQAQFFLKVAHNAGIDIDSLDNNQLNTLWNQFEEQQAKLATEGGESCPSEDKETKKEKAKAYVESEKEAAAQFAAYDFAGRQMAHAYVNEMRKIASQAESTKEASYHDLDQVAAEQALEKAASAGYARDEAANRLNAVLTLSPPESEKIAFVQNFEDALDVRSSELLELAGYPVNWEGTPFEKQAFNAPMAATPEEAEEAAKDVADKIPSKSGVGSAAEAGETIKGRTGKIPFGAKAKYFARKHGPKAAIGAGVGVLAGGTYLATRKKDKDKDKKKAASAEADLLQQFEINAGNLAIEKAASNGWNAEEATERVRAVFTLGAGSPAESEKVASANNAEQAMDLRACELLELAGYKINW